MVLNFICNIIGRSQKYMEFQENTSQLSSVVTTPSTMKRPTYSNTTPLEYIVPLIPTVKKTKKGFGQSKNFNQKKDPQIYCSTTKPKQNNSTSKF